MLATDAHTLAATDFPELNAGRGGSGPSPAPEETSLSGVLEAAERGALEAALDACEGNKAKAARRLGIGRTTLYRRLGQTGR